MQLFGKMQFKGVKRPFLTISAMAFLLGPPAYKEFTKKEVYPSVILPRGSSKVNHSRATMPFLKSYIVIVSLQGDEYIMKNLDDILPDGMPSKYGGIVLEGIYAEQQKPKKNESSRIRVETRRRLLLDWLYSRGFDSTAKIILVTQPMVLNLHNGRTDESDTARKRTIHLNPYYPSDL